MHQDAQLRTKYFLVCVLQIDLIGEMVLSNCARGFAGRFFVSSAICAAGFSIASWCYRMDLYVPLKVAYIYRFQLKICIEQPRSETNPAILAKTNPKFLIGCPR